MIFRIILAALILLSCGRVKNEEVDDMPVKVVEAVLDVPSREISEDPSLIDPKGQILKDRILPPNGFRRVDYDSGSFAHYLQHFPLKKDGSKVFLFDGREKTRQDVHAAVLDIDVGKRDLQQCADAIMRLRSEFLWKEKRFGDIHFNFTNGFRADYLRWRQGERIRVNGNQVNWVNGAEASTTYRDFRKFLTMVFSYAGTLSLAKELAPQDLEKIEVGDVFIRGGSPGHAVLVMDKAIQESSGQTLILLAQSYMPAQDIHILRNFNNEAISPWYAVENFDFAVHTPEWDFTIRDLKKF